MKGASFARQGEASDLELVPTWVAVWVRFFDPHRKTTICNKKSPKTEVFEDFWSCWADLNRRPHPYQFFFTCFYLLCIGFIYLL